MIKKYDKRNCFAANSGGYSWGVGEMVEVRETKFIPFVKHPTTAIRRRDCSIGCNGSVTRYMVKSHILEGVVGTDTTQSNPFRGSNACGDNKIDC